MCQYINENSLDLDWEIPWKFPLNRPEVYREAESALEDPVIECKINYFVDSDAKMYFIPIYYKYW